MSAGDERTATIELRHVERAMGTVFSLTAVADAADRTRLTAAVVRAVAWLHEVDDRFTTYRPSDWLRLVDGELALADAHPDLRHVVDRAERLRGRTRGAFALDADPRRPPDPAAYVKGWATQRAADLLRDAGATAVCVNGGGDVAVHGDRTWRVGVQDPFARDAVLGVVELAEGAVATSGRYERGDHLFDAATHAPATTCTSVTVIGPDLGLADAYGTALFARPDATGWFDDLDGFGALVVGMDRTVELRGDLRDVVLALDTSYAIGAAAGNRS